MFTMSWEIDVWGRIKASQQAAGQEAEVAEQSIKDRRTIVELVRGRFS